VIRTANTATPTKTTKANFIDPCMGPVVYSDAGSSPRAAWVLLADFLVKRCVVGRRTKPGLESNPEILAGANRGRNRAALREFLTPEATKSQYLHGVQDATLVAAEAYELDSALLARPGNDESQLDLFLDYASNVNLYPKFQEYFRNRRHCLRSGERTTLSSCLRVAGSQAQ
jgi:hypothetical protein